MGHNGLLNNQKGVTQRFKLFAINLFVCLLVYLVDLVPPEENIKEFADAEDRLEDSELM